MGSEELESALRRLKRPSPPRVDVSPESPFDALLEQRIRHLERHVEELKTRVYGLIFMVIGAVMVQTVLGLLR
ncbi:MAG: hypothetical protein HYX93_06070 [Chloroflexi bacterium]|nr:hypothetical protein [Chloroflexota bacterium]